MFKLVNRKDLTAGILGIFGFFRRLIQVVADCLPIFLLEQLLAAPGLSMDRVAAHGSQSVRHGESNASEPATVHRGIH